MNDIHPEELLARLDSKEKLKILDVREKWEYEEANLGMENIPFYELPFNLHILAPYKQVEIILHCNSGNKSQQAKLYLEQQGFKKVRSLISGMEGFLLLKNS